MTSTPEPTPAGASASQVPITPDARGLRVPPWREVPRTGQVMAGAYLRAGAGERLSPRARAVLRPLVGVGFSLQLVVHRPFVRWWRDPRDPRRQIVVSVIPRWGTAVLVLRVALVLGVLGAALIVLPSAMSTPGLGLAVLVLLTTVAMVIAAGAFAALILLALPYPGLIRSAGPAVPGTDITVGLAASTAPGGMRAVRAHLADHHPGARITVRARDEHALWIYAALGLEVVEPGSGRMTAVLPSAPRRPDV